MRSQFLAVLAVSSLALVSCSSAEAPAEPTPATASTAPSQSPKESTAAPSNTAEANEEAFLNDLDSKQWMGKKLSDDKLVTYAEDICETLEDGDTVDPNLLGGKTEDKMDTITILMAAQAKMCPETMN